MKLTAEHKKPLDWPKLIYQYRTSLRLNQAEFGRLFGVSRQSVYYWEIGKNEAPYDVTWAVHRYFSQEPEEE